MGAPSPSSRHGLREGPRRDRGLALRDERLDPARDGLRVAADHPVAGDDLAAHEVVGEPVDVVGGWGGGAGGDPGPPGARGGGPRAGGGGRGGRPAGGRWGGPGPAGSPGRGRRGGPGGGASGPRPRRRGRRSSGRAGTRSSGAAR